MPGFEIIQARIKDDIAVLIDRLMRSKEQEVIFVLPKNSIVALSPESLKLLQQEAESIGKILSISTENQKLKSFAKKFKVPIYDPDATPKSIKMEKTERPRSVKRMTDILPPEVYLSEENLLPELEPEPEISLLSEAPIYEVSQKSDLEAAGNMELEKNLENFYSRAKETPILKINKTFSWNRLILPLIILGGLSLLSSFYLILPKANIKISIKKIPVKIDIPVAVSKNISSPILTSGIIPGQYFMLSKSGSKTFEISGARQEVAIRARGFINIYNAYSAASQKLVAQTRFETKDGKIFRIQKSVIVPGAKVSGNKLTPSVVRAEVAAEEPGEEYNIGPSFFTIPGFKESPKYAGFYAKSVEPMVSSKGSATIVLTPEVLELKKKELLQELAKGLEDDTLSAVKDSNLELIGGASAVKIEEFKYAVPAGASADSATISMKITWQAVVFKEKDFKTLVDYYVSDKYPDLKSFSFSGNITYPKATRTDFKKGELFFTYGLNEENALTADVNGLKKELAGRSEDEMRQLISSKNFINSAAISLWPFWVKNAPGSPERINITVDNK